MSKREYLTHDALPPFLPEGATILILGSFPSPKSRECGFYYGHPQNRFWKTLAGVFEDDVPQSLEQKKAFLDRHHIALWDVIASCSIVGASDSSIADVVANDIPSVVTKQPIQLIVTTGKKADALFHKYFKDDETIAAIAYLNLPSTSPANARMRLPDLIAAYQVIKRDE